VVTACSLMNVTINFLGILSEYIGTDTVFMELLQGATYGDLLNEVSHKFGDRLPKGVWDKENCQFRAGVLSIGEGRDLETKETVLKDGENITIVVHMAGG